MTPACPHILAKKRPRAGARNSDVPIVPAIANRQASRSASRHFFIEWEEASQDLLRNWCRDRIGLNAAYE